MNFKVTLANHISSTTPRRALLASKHEKLLRFLRENGIGIQEAIGWLGGKR